MFSFLKKIFSVIDYKDKRRLAIIFFLILGSSFLDLIGLSSIVPVVTVLSAPNVDVAIESNFFLEAVSTLFRTTEAVKLSIISLVFLLLVSLFKVFYSIGLVYINNKFVMSFNRRLRERLMRTYLAMPYEYHHENNSSTLIRKSTYDVDIFTTAVREFLDFIVRITTTIIIAVYLFLSSYIAALIISGLLFVFACFIVFVLRKRVKKLGKKIQELNSHNYNYLSQSFNGVKESKISNTEEFFVKQYTRNICYINNLTLRRYVYSAIPGQTLEFVGMVGMAVSLLVVIAIGIDSNYEIISTFSVFAYAVIKLLPFVTGITSFINAFAFYSSSVDSIYNDLEELRNLEGQAESYGKYDKLCFDDTISLRNVYFSYKDNPEKMIVRDISFNIRKNTSVAISGASGAGKTTLVDIILGLLKPVKGSINCDNVDINTNIRGWRDNISYVPQNIYLMDDTIRNNVVFGLNANRVNDKMVWDALEKAQLKEFVEQSPDGLDTIIGERGIRLSGGQRQRIGIARAFYRNTNIIVLDEATSALDYETERNILDHISAYSVNHTLIIITHRLDTIESCDYIYKITNGMVECVKEKK